MHWLRERYSLIQFQQRFATEEACLDHLEQARWPYGPVCPRCDLLGESSRLTARPHVHQCAACHKQFSVTAHTPLHKTHLALSVWFTVLYLLTQSRKGISTRKLSVLLGLQYRTTWHLYHRIRLMMQEANPLLRDVIELDETYAGSPLPKVAGRCAASAARSLRPWPPSLHDWGVDPADQLVQGVKSALH